MDGALVTGTSRGIGLSVAQALLERGWNVMGIARGAAPAELQHEHYQHVELDLTDVEALETWLRKNEQLQSLALEGTRFALVNNAGTLQPMTLLPNATAAGLRDAFALNTIAPMLLSGFAVQHVAARVPVRIVDISSGAADGPYPGWGSYCATKAALSMAGRVLIAETEQAAGLKDHDVALLSFAPGVVDTAMQNTIRATDESDFPHRTKFRTMHSQGVLVHPSAPAHEIAEWLSSAHPRSSHESRRFGG